MVSRFFRRSSYSKESRENSTVDTEWIFRKLTMAESTATAKEKPFFRSHFSARKKFNALFYTQVTHIGTTSMNIQDI